MTHLLLIYWLVLQAVPGRTFQNYYGQILITEIMSDPSPPVGLPNAEYLELLNTGSTDLSLKNWKLTIGQTQILLPDTLLPAGSYILLCHKNNLSLFTPYGRLCGLSSLTLPNDGASLALYSSTNQLVYAVSYSSSWWEPSKRQGGYALEIKDIHAPCTDRENWQASVDPLGGTPSKINSIVVSLSDRQSPQLAYYGLYNQQSVRMVFSERLDSLKLSFDGSFVMDGSPARSILLQRPEFSVVQASLPKELQIGIGEEFRIRNVSDCAGNLMPETSIRLGLPVIVDSGAVLISEVLFNSLAEGVDYVELVNHSNNFVNLSGWKLGNVRNGRNENEKLITSHPLLIPPYGYLVVSIDGLKVFRQYPYDEKPLVGGRRYVNVSQLPAYALDTGGVVLFNDQGKVVDRLLYSQSMHDPLLAKQKGVSLERVNLQKPSNAPGNWQSASGASGFGTPGYANSQRYLAEALDLVVVEPEGFSPNGDGIDDIALVRFSFTRPGHFANVSIFNQNGRLIKILASNLSVGGQDTLVWDGTDQQGNLVAGGYYFIVSEVWNASGYRQTFKCKLVLGR
ncbi:lamin tail domain-containing protein [Dyadobacter tibetensis]|uniref:lamin tail domain-containing protein n=1 Tax=Dyadobacter tibetensis TaxID=1211851 RepID=UPI000472DA4C|nr:lamin tail domain-containing protein [Dyadobacter tibetensis]